MRRILPIALLVALVAPFAPVRAAGRVHEKDLNLDITHRVAARLAVLGIPVVWTRTGDQSRSLDYRTGLANARKVDAFISIHNNAAPSSSAAWSEVYHQIRSSGSRSLGASIRSALDRRLGSDPAYLKTRRGDHGDYYHQLRTSRMPAVIVEGAFLSNPRQLRLLRSSSYRQAIADSIVDGIAAYQKTLRRTATLPDVAAALRVEVPALPAPEAGRAAALNSHTVRLSWAPGALPAGAGTRIYRDGAPVGHVEAGQTSFEDVWAAPGQRYRYELRTAVRAAGAAVAAVAESEPFTLVVRTPPIVVCLDAGHGGSDTGAIGRY